jgi:hypothetical protein
MDLFGQSDTLNGNKTAAVVKYFEKADTLVTIKLNVNNEFEFFKQQGENFTYDIRPNISLSSKLAFSYRFISFSIHFTPKFIPGNDDDTEQGKTKAFALGFTIITSHFVQDLHIGKIEGFYLHNSADFIPGWDESKDPYIQLPNLRIASLSGSSGYKFNPNYSLKSISSQSEIQLKSCGSFFPSISYNYYEIDNEDPSGSRQSSQKSNNFEALANAGYFYTFVLNSKFYIAAGIIPGIGFNYTHLITRLPAGNIYNSYNDLVLRSKEKAGLGYNSGKLFAGAEFSISNSFRNMNQTSVQLEATRIFFQIFVDYRFTAPKFLRHETDVVKKAVPGSFQKFLE